LVATSKSVQLVLNGNVLQVYIPVLLLIASGDWDLGRHNSTTADVGVVIDSCIEQQYHDGTSTSIV
jgi:hypothetical protein